MKRETKTKDRLILFVIFFLSPFLFCSCTPYSEGEPIEKNLPVKYAIVIMDMQEDFILLTGKLPVDQDQAGEALQRINVLLSSINANTPEVIYIGNEFSPSDYIGNWFRNHAAISGQNGTRLVSGLKVVNDTYFAKNHPDAFSTTEFDTYLRERKISHLIFAGVFADQCVMSTVKGALQRQCRVSVLPEAVAAKNKKNKEKAIQKYRNLGVELLSMDDAIEQLKKR